ncbi:hypothetical protein RJ640_022662 [Escallonia rubra]|uniref:Peptidase S8/S53 domain-containing protein n=1 Tax=Escallonia rubra TaxID=112253 RepID=A0AA88UGQ6_9ASTE|nr:hypothetical protein RJ640_022662 [Escallonia rubra]
MYKVSWGFEGTYASDVIAGMDQAVADGCLYADPIAIASFGAMENGVLVSSSAGNDGPGFGTLHNGVPWALTVAAGSIDRSFGGTLTLGNVASSKVTAAIFVSESPEFLFYTLYYPGVVISPKDALALVSYVERHAKPTASIRFQQTIVGTKPAPAVASYTSRGPAPSYPGILKPDVMAPGTLVLAAWVPNRAVAAIGTRITGLQVLTHVGRMNMTFLRVYVLVHIDDVTIAIGLIHMANPIWQKN